jgi:hypothetical protein
MNVSAAQELVAGDLAAKRTTCHRPPAVASYNTRLAELDARLSRELASRLRAAGLDFDAAVVNVEGPACQRAVCLVKGPCRENKEGLSSVLVQISGRHIGNGMWSFAGRGELAAVKFDVDAAAEMRRLAESTPPEFPQVAFGALVPNQPQPDAASSFAREIRVVLTCAAPGERRRWLKREEGGCLTEPDWDYFDTPSAHMDWCRTNSLDLAPATDPDQHCWLFTCGMVVAPVGGKLWEQATPDNLISHPKLRASSQFRFTDVSPARDKWDTYLFRTQQGTMGILRLLEFNPAARQLKIQYKLARVGAKTDT